ncbi:MAG: histidine phosphatase family protein [Fibrobacter sp.]|nr:histidine phosphatase family protein [Fibrobacter sp.]
MRYTWYAISACIAFLCLATSCSSDGNSPVASVESSASMGNTDSVSNPEIPEPDKEKVSILDTLTVEDADDLPLCDEGRAGRFFFVGDESLPYFCVNGEWRGTADSTDFSITCSNGELQVVSKIVHNPQADPSTDNFQNPQVQQYYGNPWDQNQYNQNMFVPSGFDSPIAGIAQKGPFIPGASVTVKEVDSFYGHEMRQIAEGCVLSNDGQFSLENVHADSNCVKISVTGFYRNEVNGGSSGNPITLSARTCDPSKANVNILTHLEIPRVDQLLMNHFDFNMAKAQAEREVFAAFGIDTTKLSNMPTAEEMSVLGESEYSAAILAISAMLMGGRDETEMMGLVNNIAEDIKGDGVWNDPNWKIKIADWVVGVDSSNRYANIRNHVTEWNLGTVPNFEKYMQAFFPMIYEFGPCTEANAGQVTFVKHGQSVYFANDYEHADHSRVRFICDATAKRWRTAKSMEKDTTGFGPGAYDKEIREGRVNHETSYIYDGGKWRIATKDEVDGFTDIVEVYKSLKPTDKAVFIIRHSERTNSTGKSGKLTENGVKYAQELGTRFAAAGGTEDFYFAHSGYTRTQQTCDNIAQGKGQTNYNLVELATLDGAWYVKNSNKVEEYSNSADGGGWAVYSKYAFVGSYSDAFYDLKSRSEELIKNIKSNLGTNRISIMCTHDYLLVPLLAYVTEGRANVRYYEKRRWLNYMSGVAMIISSDGSVNYIPVRSLEKGTMQ